MDLNFGVKISWWLLGKPKFCSDSQETALLTPAENNSNCGDVGGGAFETSGACGGVRILKNANIISRRKKKVFPKGAKLEGNES